MPEEETPDKEISETIQDLISDKNMGKKFLEKRKIFLWGPVTDESSKELTAKLMYLEMADPGKPITFYINSPGGVVTSGLVVYDTMQMISSPVHTVCMGMAASMGSILLIGGKKGNRYIWPNGRVMIHQPSIGGQIQAPATDLLIHAQDIVKTKEKLNQMLADACGKSYEQLVEDTDRDYYMDADQALAYGIVDKIVNTIDVV
ncbi:ATP-dependent Clp protease proteolytic subunit [Leptospira sp. 201903075]|uniref:ClpP family protease n=1 Tax=Leptospira chreensis TaxID=2810035 RepID=UPI001966C121|nr:ATP-dependent Clp protease proteolytic subunit [Leptospira chreensis]MBM9590625.1 ATP-dependent Clp protease proteolytic subunit [Leptospira chreensis]